MRIHLVPMLVILGFGFPGTSSAELPPDSKLEPGQSLAAGNLDGLWSDLADADAAKAYRAIWALTKTPNETVAHIAGKMEPAVTPEQGKVKRLIEDLNSDTFTVREKANRELIMLGGLVEPTLRKALKANAFAR